MYIQYLIASNDLAIPLILNNVSIHTYQPENIYKNQIFLASRKSASHL